MWGGLHRSGKLEFAEYEYFAAWRVKQLARAPSVIRQRRMPAYASASLRNLCPFRATPHWGAGSSRREPFGCIKPQLGKESTTNISLAPSGCSTARKGTVAANLQRFASALAEIQSKPLQPEPPSTAAAKQTTKREKRGDRGESTILHFNIHLPLSPLANSPLGSRGTRMPRRLCAARVDDPSTRESGSLRQATPAFQGKKPPQIQFSRAHSL